MTPAWRKAMILPAVLAGIAAMAQPGRAQTVEPPESLGSLRGVSPPKPPAAKYNRLVKDVAALRVLGKALFWDTAIGSDGVACASCHFNAGADPRIKNQLNPGLLAEPLPDFKFGETEFNTINLKSPLTGSGTTAAPNITLKPRDFPFHRLEDPTNRESAIRYSTNDVASSQGAFEGAFLSVRFLRTRTGRRDVCDRRVASIFSIPINGKLKNVRKVEPRNTPTTINAAFFFRNFWDGRANNVFNGIDPLGRRTTESNPNARIVVQGPPNSSPRLEKVELENMSLASQAVGPVLSDFEMSCEGRKFADVGRKILPRVPLGGQAVAASDSVLGDRVRASGRGLKSRYQELVQSAFQNSLWNAAATYQIQDGKLNAVPAPEGFTLSELNFSLFFGLAIDAYERTLISDRTRFDDHEEGKTAALTSTEKQGLELFKGKGKCTACHVGPLLSGAAVPPRQRKELVENMVMGDGGKALYDGGFYNIGVRPTFEDPGLGDNINGPLSFSRQLVSGNRLDKFPNPKGGTLPRIAVDGAFKTPTLRNIGLTAPYFHNGGEATLRQVVEFYNRGGNRRGPNGNDTTGSGPNGRPNDQAPLLLGPSMGGSNLDADIEKLNLSNAEIDAIVAFMLTLTDQRVACHKAPFDHPQLIVTDGQQPIARGARTVDIRKEVPAVGRGGYTQCDKNSGNLFDRNLAAILKPVP